MSSPTRAARKTKGSGLVHRAAGHGIAGLLDHRQRFAGQHRFVHRRTAVADFAVHRDFFARSHPDQVADPQGFDGDIPLLIALDPPGGFRPQAEQALDGGRGFAARPAFQRGAEIDQGDDGDRRLEVGVLGQAGHAGGKQGHQHRIRPGGAGAQGDQGIHVGVVMAKLTPSAAEEMAAAVDHRHQGQQAGRDPEPAAAGTGQRRQPAGQSRHQQGCGQDTGNDSVANQTTVMSLFGGVALGLVGGVAQFGGVVASLLNRPNQYGQGCIAADLGGALGEIDTGLGHAGYPTQGDFHGGDAAGATHAVHGQTQGLNG